MSFSAPQIYSLIKYGWKLLRLAAGNSGMKGWNKKPKSLSKTIAELNFIGAQTPMRPPCLFSSRGAHLHFETLVVTAWGIFNLSNAYPPVLKSKRKVQCSLAWLNQDQSKMLQIRSIARASYSLCPLVPWVCLSVWVWTGRICGILWTRSWLTHRSTVQLITTEWMPNVTDTYILPDD